MAPKANPVRIALTMGDPFGIGPEVAAAALDGTSAEVTVYGDPALFPRARRIVPVPVHARDLKRPVLRQIVRQAGLAEEEFLKLL